MLTLAGMKINPLRFDFARLRLTGVGSHAILDASLRITTTQSLKIGVWEQMHKLRSTAALPSGCIFGLTVKNPRLSFPPRKAKIDTEINEKFLQLNKFLSSGEWPIQLSECDEFWDASFREKLSAIGTKQTKDPVEVVYFQMTELLMKFR